MTNELISMSEIATEIIENHSGVNEVLSESLTINLNLWETVQSIFDFLNNVLGIIIAITTIVIFIKTYISKNVKFVHWMSGYSMFDGYTIGVVIQSRCLSTISIERVALILEEEEIILKSTHPFHKLDDSGFQYLILEPFKSLSIISDGSITPLCEKQIIDYNNISLRLTYSDGKTKEVKYKRQKSPEKINKNAKRANRKLLEGVLCTRHLWYVVKVISPDGEISIYPIYGHDSNGYGSIEKNFYNIKNVANSVMQNEYTVKSFFEGVIGDKKYIVEVTKNDEFIGNRKT